MRLLFGLLLSICVFSTTAQATQFVIGINQTLPEIDGQYSLEEDGKIGLQAGVRTLVTPYLKLGVDLAYREMSVLDGAIDFSFLSGEIPVFFTFMVGAESSVYFGPKLAFLISTKCKTSSFSCTVLDEAKSDIFVPLEIGFNWMFAGSMGLEFFYQHHLTPVLDHSTDGYKYFSHNAGVNFVYGF